MQQQQQQMPPGTLFGLPGVTQPFDQYENLTNVVTQLALSNQVPWNPSSPFQKTDIVKWWELEIAVNFGTTVTGATLSPEAPYNFLQNLKLKMQGQYSPLEVASGFDAWFFQSYRPMRGPGQMNVQNLGGTNYASTYANSAIPQANQTTTGITTNPAGGTTWNWTLEIPGGLFIDKYWDLAEDGTLLPNAQGVVAPQSAFVSPQYMGGGERVVQPQFQYAALNSSNLDNGPLVGSTAGAATATVNARRIGVYGSANPAVLPPVFNWQYRRSTTIINMGAVTKFDLPITEYGQLLSTYARIVNPTSGNYQNVANITKAQLLYGSNLPRYDDDINTMQRRFGYQHGFVPPQGTVVWDMAATTSGEGISNDARVLNTLTNSNCHVHLEFASALDSTSYAVLGTELLVPVSTQ